MKIVLGKSKSKEVLCILLQERHPITQCPLDISKKLHISKMKCCVSFEKLAIIFMVQAGEANKLKCWYLILLLLLYNCSGEHRCTYNNSPTYDNSNMGSEVVVAKDVVLFGQVFIFVFFLLILSFVLNTKGSFTQWPFSTAASATPAELMVGRRVACKKDDKRNVKAHTNRYPS